MTRRRNTITVIAFFAGLVLLDVVVFAIPQYRTARRRADAKLRRIQAFNNLRANYQQMLSAASRDQQSEFNQAFKAVLNQNLTILTASNELGDTDIAEPFSYANLNCIHRAARFNVTVRDQHRTNPSLALPQPAPRDLQDCIYPENTASFP